MAELMIAVAVFLLVVATVLLSYLRCMELTETAGNTSKAIEGEKSQMEEILATPFDQLVSTYNQTTFTINGLNGIGVIYIIDDSINDFYKIKIVFCWRQKNGRIIGEDKNLNGSLDNGEDSNGNGQIDSIAVLETAVFNE